MRRRIATSCCLCCALLAGAAAFAQPASTRPADDAPPPTNGDATAGLPLLRADNPAAIKEHVGERVIVVGTIERAEWSRSGKVCNVNFAGADDEAFGVAIFSSKREQFDEAFGGDVAATLAGAEVRLTGVVTEYGGRSDRYEGRPELILNEPRQITIVTPATTQPAE